MATAAPTAAPGGTVAAFVLADSRLDEVSGIAAGIASPGVVYVENDSGDSARFFALDAADGRLLATYRVPGATNVDWEDIAVAPDVRGVPSVWLADIGDNGADRDHVTIYRVDEPHVDHAFAGAELDSGPAQVWRLRYPGRPVDAESLAVSPAGVPYVVSKSVLGASTVYSAPARPPAGVGTLTTVGEIRFSLTGTPGPFGPLGQLAATGADLSRDGRLFTVRTYTDAYLWQVSGGDLAAALRERPGRLALPRQPQGEAICFDGGQLLVASEGVGTTVYSVPLPEARPAESTPAGPPSPSTSASASPGGVRDGRPGGGWWMAVPVAAALVAIALGLSRLRRPPS